MNNIFNRNGQTLTFLELSDMFINYNEVLEDIVPELLESMKINYV